MSKTLYERFIDWCIYKKCIWDVVNYKGSFDELQRKIDYVEEYEKTKKRA